MRFLVGENWKDYFDVVIVQARKPRFFTEESRPLRIYDEVKQTQLWDRVTKLNKGVIYLEVSPRPSSLFARFKAQDRTLEAMKNYAQLINIINFLMFMLMFIVADCKLV